MQVSNSYHDYSSICQCFWDRQLNCASVNMAPDYGTRAAVARNWSFPLIYLRNLILFKLLCVKSNEWDSVSTKSYQKSVKCTRGVTLHFARLLGQIQLVLMRARQLMITSKTINILFSYTLNNIRRSSNLLISRGLCLLILSTS